jgi:hypothetical protein
MNITLRRANKLRVKVEARVNEVAALLQNPNASVSVYAQDIPAKLLERREAFLKTMARHGALNNVLTNLRRTIAAANVEAEVSNKLAYTAGLQRERNILRRVAEGDVMPSQAEIDATVRGATATVNSYRHSDDVSFGVLSEDILKEVNDRLRKIDLELSALEDAREGINANVKITLDPSHEAILKAEGLIA